MTRRRAPRVLSLKGELTIYVVAERKSRLLDLLESETGAIIDLAGVTELDAAGLQLLLLIAREATSRGVTLRLRNPSQAVRDVLVLTRLTDELEIVEEQVVVAPNPSKNLTVTAGLEEGR